MDNIEIERIWQDDDFFEVKITCSSKMIIAVTKTYTTNESIDNFSNIIGKFIDEDVGNCLWENGKKDNGTTAYVSMNFCRKDKLGHIQIEVFMELHDGNEYGKHNCRFFVETELGLLQKFRKNLCTLKEQKVGNKAVLVG